jgi:hypothetical protein
VASTWSVTWTPPAATASAVTPTLVPQTCLTLEKWQQALAQPVPLPAEVAGRLIAYGRIVDDGQPPSPENLDRQQNLIEKSFPAYARGASHYSLEITSGA